jgi:hypothetical protein
MKRIFAILVALAVSAGVTACGDKSSGGGAGGGVVGTWTLDLQKAIDLGMAEAKKKLAELPEDQRKMAEEMMGGKAAREMMEKQLGGMKMEFNVAADKSFTAMQGPEKRSPRPTGRLGRDGGKYVFTVKTKNGQPATGESREARGGSHGGANLVLSMGRPELAFKRK